MNKSSKGGVWARVSRSACACMQMHSNSSWVTEPEPGPNIKKTCGVRTQSHSRNVASGSPWLFGCFWRANAPKRIYYCQNVAFSLFPLSGTQLQRFHQKFFSWWFLLLPPPDKKLVPLFQEEDRQQRALIGLVRPETHAHSNRCDLASITVAKRWIDQLKRWLFVRSWLKVQMLRKEPNKKSVSGDGQKSVWGRMTKHFLT